MTDGVKWDLAERCKLNLRIRHDRLDAEIETCIETAAAQLIRVGVPSSVVNEAGVLVQEAIIAYVMYRYAEADNEIYQESFRCQADDLRRHRSESDETE